MGALSAIHSLGVSYACRLLSVITNTQRRKVITNAICHKGKQIKRYNIPQVFNHGGGIPHSNRHAPAPLCSRVAQKCSQRSLRITVGKRVHVDSSSTSSALTSTCIGPMGQVLSSTSGRWQCLQKLTCGGVRAKKQSIEAAQCIAAGQLAERHHTPEEKGRRGRLRLSGACSSGPPRLCPVTFQHTEACTPRQPGSSPTRFNTLKHAPPGTLEGHHHTMAH